VSESEEQKFTVTAKELRQGDVQYGTRSVVDKPPVRSDDEVHVTWLLDLEQYDKLAPDGDRVELKYWPHSQVDLSSRGPEAGQAQSAEMYVLAMSVGPVRVSTDLDALKALAEKRQAGAVLATEFKWDPDEYSKDAERVLLYHVSKATGKWNKSGYYIDKVPVL
jgi:hypothetical protein